MLDVVARFRASRIKSWRALVIQDMSWKQRWLYIITVCARSEVCRRLLSSEFDTTWSKTIDSLIFDSNIEAVGSSFFWSWTYNMGGLFVLCVQQFKFEGSSFFKTEYRRLGGFFYLRNRKLRSDFLLSSKSKIE